MHATHLPQYALKLNGSLGYADTAAGEGLEGEIMEKFGFPALKKMGLKTIGACFFMFISVIFIKTCRI